MSYLLAISASPRRHGNSESILQSFTDGVHRAEFPVKSVRLNGLNIRPCQACDRCAPTGQCVIRDDMQALYTAVEKARALVLATPIYFGTLSAQLKIFIDRFQCWWQAKYNLKTPFVTPEEERPGFFICVGALRNPAYCENAAQIVGVFFHNINYKFIDRLCLQGFDEKGSIARDPETVKQAFNRGRDFAEKYLKRNTPEGK